MQKVSRRDFTRLMAIGGASFLASGLLPDLFKSQSLLHAAQKQGFGDPALDKGVVTTWARLHFRCTNGDDDDWNAHPHGDANLLQKLNQETSVNISESWHVAEVSKLEELIRFPLIFMHAEAKPELNPQEIANLREYLMRGGFLYAEDCVMGKKYHNHSFGNWDFFFTSMQAILRDLIPAATFERLPVDHPIFHAYFDLPKGQPHMQGIAHGGWGLTHNKRLVAYLSPSDAHCGWTSEGFFGAAQTREAVKMGTNVYLYAMTH